MIPFPIFHGFHEPLYLITFLPNNLGSIYHLKEFLKLVFTAAKLTKSVAPGCWAMRIALLLWKPIVAGWGNYFIYVQIQGGIMIP
jgi:hypothetical protein